MNFEWEPIGYFEMEQGKESTTIKLDVLRPA